MPANPKRVAECRMPAFAVDYRKIIQIVAPLAAALVAVSAAGRMPAQAETSHILVIPASDGYGFDDCMGSNKACGRVIADAWCEAHGMSASISYGRSEDVTASIGSEKTDAAKSSASIALQAKLLPGTFVVTCKE